MSEGYLDQSGKMIKPPKTGNTLGKDIGYVGAAQAAPMDEHANVELPHPDQSLKDGHTKTKFSDVQDKDPDLERAKAKMAADAAKSAADLQVPGL